MGTMADCTTETFAGDGRYMADSATETFPAKYTTHNSHFYTRSMLLNQLGSDHGQGPRLSEALTTLSQITGSREGGQSEEMICFVIPEMWPFDVQRKSHLESTYQWKQRKV